MQLSQRLDYGGFTLSRKSGAVQASLRDEVTHGEGAAAPAARFRTDSKSETVVLDAMQPGDLLPYAKFDVEGYKLDFARLEQGIKLNPEVDGDPHLDARGL